MTGLQIRQASTDDLDAALPALTGILHACVHAGASVGFILPFAPDQARTFWSEAVFPAVHAGGRILFLAYDSDVCIGTVQLIVGQPPNQPHRADVAKMLVHPDARRQGAGRALLRALLASAESLGKSLLVLDTRSTDPAKDLYQSEGFNVAGEIPNYCRNPFEPVLEPTTYMFKSLP